MFPKVIIRDRIGCFRAWHKGTKHISRKNFNWNLETYHSPEKVYVRRLVELTLEVSLGAAPIVIARQHSFDASALGPVSGVFQVSDLHPVDHQLSTNMVVADHDIVGLDI